MGAPVCVIQPQFKQPSAPPVLTASVPIANESNVVAAVNALRAYVLATSNSTPAGGGSNPYSTPSGVGASPSFGPLAGANAQTPPNGFVVTNQVVTQVTIKDPNSAASVTINQIVGLTMTDSVTGQTWGWAAPAGLN